MANTDNEKRPLNTNEMQAKLKGDSFPDMWDDFLDEDIQVFFTQALEQSGRSKADVIRRANISRTYGYQLMDGKRLGKRDYYLSLAIAMKLDLTQTQRMLAVTHCGGLHALIKRDAAVIFAVNHGYDNESTYTFMEDLELPPLDTGLEDEK
jgi:hypothetical protein